MLNNEFISRELDRNEFWFGFELRFIDFQLLFFHADRSFQFIKRLESFWIIF